VVCEVLYRDTDQRLSSPAVKRLTAS
jgi:hypothetical protein